VKSHSKRFTESVLGIYLNERHPAKFGLYSQRDSSASTLGTLSPACLLASLLFLFFHYLTQYNEFQQSVNAPPFY